MKLNIYIIRRIDHNDYYINTSIFNSVNISKRNNKIIYNLILYFRSYLNENYKLNV